MAHVERLSTEASKKISTSVVNQTLAKMVLRHSPQLIKKYGKRIKFYFATQVRSNPPTIVVKCNVAEEIQESYKRYMVNTFRKELGFPNVPIRLLMRGKKEDKRKKQEAESVLML